MLPGGHSESGAAPNAPPRFVPVMTNKNMKGISRRLLALDQKIHDIARPYADLPPMRLLERIGKAGDQPPMLSLSAAVLATGLLSERPRMMFAGARMIAAHLIATAAKNVVKRQIDRERPAPRLDGKAPHPRPGKLSSKRMTGFPSGHTAGSIAVARAFGRAYPEHAAKAAGVAGLVAVAQVARRKHYLTDVLAGLAIGLASEAALTRLVPVRR